MDNDINWEPLAESEHLAALRQRALAEEEAESIGSRLAPLSLAPMGPDSSYRGYGESNAVPGRPAEKIDFGKCRAMVVEPTGSPGLSIREVRQTIHRHEPDEERDVVLYRLFPDRVATGLREREFGLGDLIPELRAREIRIINNLGLDFLLVPEGTPTPAGISGQFRTIYF